MKKICIITTMWSSINNWIKPFLNEYHKQGVDVTIVCNMDQTYMRELTEEYPFIHAYPIAFPRGINVSGSVKGIVKLYKLFRKSHFDLVQYSTPNASMYASIASFLARIPVRLYCQWGMVCVSMTGIKRAVFEMMERLVCTLSTEIQPDSIENLEYCRSKKFYSEKKSRVIWNGSAKGLNLTAFDVEQKEKYAKEIKEKYNIPEGVPVVGFVGRLGREKGCQELFLAFQEVKKTFSDAMLLFVGPIEKEETIEPELLQYFWECDDIIKTDRVSNVEKYMSAMDVFVLPSYREGFGMSVIEASAMEVPVIVTKYPGPHSALKEGVSGFSVPVKDVDGLIVYIEKLLSDKDLAKQIGKNGRQYVLEEFDQKIFIKKYMDNRMSLLSGNHNGKVFGETGK